MNTKTIQAPQGLIVWDSFRGSFNMLMNTVTYLIECKVLFNIEGYTPKPYLSFKIYNTNGFQEETRKVIGNESVVFTKEYDVKEVSDDILKSMFDSFYNDYIQYKEKRIEIANMHLNTMEEIAPEKMKLATDLAKDCIATWDMQKSKQQ